MEGKSVMQMQAYGKVVVKLRPLLEQRGISRNAFAKQINTRFEVVDKWYDGGVERIDADILARVCYALDCRVEDILEYQTE